AIGPTQVVICALGNIPVSGSATVSISAAAVTISIMTNVATVTSYEIDLQPADNLVAQPTAVALFSNFAGGSISIPGVAAQGSSSGGTQGNPYPATISVSGLTSSVHAVSVILS